MVLPEWLPNIHPLLVHFPIAFLILAVLLDIIAAFVHRVTWLRPAVALLYGVGALAAIGTYFSGRVAADSVFPPAEANAVLTEHADLALYTVLLFGILALFRIGVIWRIPVFRPLVDGPMILVGLIGLGLLALTADHGGELVYRFGVGVQAAQQEEASAQPAASMPIEFPDGSWVWRFGEGADRGFVEVARVIEGVLQEENLEVLEDSSKGPFLRWTVMQDTVHVTVGKPLQDIQIDLTLRVQAFDGHIWVTHHIQDAEHYRFSGLVLQPREEEARVIIGRREGAVTIEADKTIPFSPTWHTLRIVADRTHYRTYIDGKMVAHTHGAVWDEGPIGLRLMGTGKVDLYSLRVDRLRP